jgi:Family of unknown function (DUF6156)
MFIIINSLCTYRLSHSPGMTMLEADDSSSFDSLTPQYFGSWRSYQIPFIPEEPISSEEAQQRKSYYVGYYNSNDRLERFEKHLDGQLNWKDEYSYWENGKIKTRAMIQADGSQIVQNFDRRGRMIE